MHSNTIVTVLITVSFIIGALGNIAVLWILYKSAKNRNRKHVFMLRCLANNDLVAQVGMLTFTYLDKYDLIPYYWRCVGFVILRAFGLGSGCVALVMALERWLALTRPFLYHQIVTYQMLKRTLCCLWLAALGLTYLPLFGFGLYYDKEKNKCVRYRNATIVNDKIYAYLFFVVGSILCLSIAFCNIAVVCELSRIRSQGKILVRRISRSIIVSNRVGCPRNQTPEEVSFAKLMIYISVIFIACWGTNLVTVPIAQFQIDNRASRIFTKIADVLLGVYFTLDPFVYVLQRYMEKGRFFPWCFTRQRSTSSIPTSTTAATPTSVLLQAPSFTLSK